MSKSAIQNQFWYVATNNRYLKPMWVRGNEKYINELVININSLSIKYY